jgi:hypothetical protein
MRRRALFRAALGLVGACSLGSATDAWAAGRDARVKDITLKPSGATLELWPKSAPFPCPSSGATWTDSTVLVFVPSYYRLPKSKKVDFVVHFHGHNTAAKEAILKHRLREQLAQSRQNAILVVPQGPWRAAEGDFGKLMLKGGLARLLDEVLGLVAASQSRLGKADVAGARERGRVVVSAHSGGYRAAAAAAERGQVDLREIYLFDALYGEVPAFKKFVTTAPERRKLVSLAVGGVPRSLSLSLAEQLVNSGVAVVSELSGTRLSRGELVRGRAVFLEGHGPHASATIDENALSACLHASCLKGRGSGAWLEDTDAPRAG